MISYLKTAVYTFLFALGLVWLLLHSLVDAVLDFERAARIQYIHTNDAKQMASTELAYMYRYLTEHEHEDILSDLSYRELCNIVYFLNLRKRSEFGVDLVLTSSDQQPITEELLNQLKTRLDLIAPKQYKISKIYNKLQLQLEGLYTEQTLQRLVQKGNLKLLPLVTLGELLPKLKELDANLKQRINYLAINPESDLGPLMELITIDGWEDTKVFEAKVSDIDSARVMELLARPETFSILGKEIHWRWEDAEHTFKTLKAVRMLENTPAFDQIIDQVILGNKRLGRNIYPLVLTVNKSNLNLLNDWREESPSSLLGLFLDEDLLLEAAVIDFFLKDLKIKDDLTKKEATLIAAMIQGNELSHGLSIEQLKWRFAKGGDLRSSGILFMAFTFSYLIAFLAIGIHWLRKRSSGQQP